MAQQLESNLRNVIEFLNLDLRTASPSALLKAKRDVLTFINSATAELEGRIDVEAVVGEEFRKSTGEVIGERHRKLVQLPDRELVKIQESGLALLQNFAIHRDIQRRQERGETRQGPAGAEIILHRITTEWLLLPVGGATKRGWAMARVRSFRDAFILKLLLVAVMEDVESIRSCPVCRKLFIRHKRQEYDTPKCQSIATSATYRENQKKKARKK